VKDSWFDAVPFLSVRGQASVRKGGKEKTKKGSKKTKKQTPRKKKKRKLCAWNGPASSQVKTGDYKKEERSGGTGTKPGKHQQLTIKPSDQPASLGGTSLGWKPEKKKQHKRKKRIKKGKNKHLPSTKGLNVGVPPTLGRGGKREGEKLLKETVV